MIAIIDYGLSNLGSIYRALEECNADVEIAREPTVLKKAEKIVLPGVGSYYDAMENLQGNGWVKVIREEVLGNLIPILGICLGMQLLSDYGEEAGGHLGLELIPGIVKLLQPIDYTERIPHVGWNEIHKTGSECAIIDNIDDGTDFYFVHSYKFVPKEKSNIAAVTPYCGSFV